MLCSLLRFLFNLEFDQNQHVKRGICRAWMRGRWLQASVEAGKANRMVSYSDILQWHANGRSQGLRLLMKINEDKEMVDLE